ncbi:MAG: antibiotic biosynthesis monooxygenase [Pseudomonadota bacterium]|nr:antibiotic biosynthesis monooxygenase [Pseudomonadota bacterium]MDQ2704939.1 antibiotic biosynthesis monooxygenase [Pseudomonadota bacterium]
MPQISIIVEYETQEGREKEFTALIKDHARRTLFEEEGCLRFEVLKPVDADGAPIPNRMMVSELYADQAAVDLHGSNPRLATVRAALGPLLKSRRLTQAQVVDEPEEAGMTPDELNASNDG